MPSIHSYAELTTLVLAESAKYFLFLLLVVLAVRLWRRFVKLPGAARRVNLILALIFTVLAAGTGYFSIRHSMSRMYYHFGMNAFHDAHLDPAFSLFDSSWSSRPNADALGAKGVCLLMSGHPDAGIAFINQAREMRGKGAPFEDFYLGLVYFYSGDETNAIPRLQSAANDPDFTWDITKIFAVIQLDHGLTNGAAKLMQPYLAADVTEPDHAYIVARLKQVDGKRDEAQALVDKFGSREMTPFWRARYAKLKSSLVEFKP
jgi:hypothetical protein